MGTRADFYIKSEENALVWLGSIAWDGYPDGIATEVLTAISAEEYKAALGLFFEKRRDVTLPERGWPWPWDDSNTTDYAYWFDGKKVVASGSPGKWFDPTRPEPESKDQNKMDVKFPNMAAFKNVRYDEGSGLLIIRAK